MSRLLNWVLPVAMSAAVLVAHDAAAQRGAQRGEEKGPENPKDPIRGSIFLFDQSMSTRAAGIGDTPQSNVPFYGWWLSFRPRWYFNKTLRVQARFDYFKEFTNSQETTNRSEDVFGDIWTSLYYDTPLGSEGWWKNTHLGAQLRAEWPTSKISQASGQYVALGAGIDATERIPIYGDDAPWLDNARLHLQVFYRHPFTDSTTPNGTGFGYVRENVDGGSFVSHQLTGQTFADHTLVIWAGASLDVTPKLSVGLDAIWINQWHYAPTDVCGTVSGAPVCLSHAGDQQFTQREWLVLEADYEMIPELSIGLGYYNLANLIAPDGTTRNSLSGEHSLIWSPDARLFLDLTANLDKIFEDASGGKYEKVNREETASARQRHVLNELH